jgi:predicted Rossmann fold flavoprotein
MTQTRNPQSNCYDVIILGAGAAGLMCAGVAGQRGHQVLVLEQSRHPAEKIRISGGGRCNFTNLHTSPANFLSDNPRFCHSALSGYTPRDFIAMVERYGIAWHEKTRGQLFCDGSSRQIIDMLLEECRKANAQLRLGVRVSAVARAENGFVSCRIRASFAVGRWWSRPAVPPFRKWDRAGSDTKSPGNSVLRSCRRGRRWCP